MSLGSDKVSWFELPADDLARATGFYSSVFGWATPDMGQDASFALTTDADSHGNPTEVGGINGGFHLRQGPSDMGPVIYLKVDDIDAKLAAVEAEGGRILQPLTVVGEYGLSMAIFVDTEGNAMGLYNTSSN